MRHLLVVFALFTLTFALVQPAQAGWIYRVHSDATTKWDSAGTYVFSHEVSDDRDTIWGNRIAQWDYSKYNCAKWIWKRAGWPNGTIIEGAAFQKTFVLPTLAKPEQIFSVKFRATADDSLYDVRINGTLLTPTISYLDLGSPSMVEWDITNLNYFTVGSTNTLEFKVKNQIGDWAGVIYELVIQGGASERFMFNMAAGYNFVSVPLYKSIVASEQFTMKQIFKNKIYYPAYWDADNDGTCEATLDSLDSVPRYRGIWVDAVSNCTDTTPVAFGMREGYSLNNINNCVRYVNPPATSGISVEFPHDTPDSAVRKDSILYYEPGSGWSPIGGSYNTVPFKGYAVKIHSSYTRNSILLSEWTSWGCTGYTRPEDEDDGLPADSGAHSDTALVYESTASTPMPCPDPPGPPDVHRLLNSGSLAFEQEDVGWISWIASNNGFIAQLSEVGIADLNYEITNMQGAIVERGIAPAARPRVVWTPSANWSSGMYLVQLHSGDHKCSKSLVIVK